MGGGRLKKNARVSGKTQQEPASAKFEKGAHPERMRALEMIESALRV